MHDAGRDPDVESGSLIDGSADVSTTLDAETGGPLDADISLDTQSSPPDVDGPAYCPQTAQYYQEWITIVASGNYMVCNTLDCPPQDCCYVPVRQQVNACVPR